MSMDKREIRFDGWTVNFDSGEITRDGNTHRLQDQPLQILEELVSRPGEVVTREQLITRLWPKGGTYEQFADIDLLPGVRAVLALHRRWSC